MNELIKVFLFINIHNIGSNQKTFIYMSLVAQIPLTQLRSDVSENTLYAIDCEYGKEAVAVEEHVEEEEEHNVEQHQRAIEAAI